MIMEAIAGFAVRCSQCSQMRLVQAALFGLKREQLEAACTCSAPLLRVYRHGRSAVRLDLLCFLCEDWHALELSQPALVRGRGEVFHCPNSGLELGLAGPAPALKQRLERGEPEFLGLAVRPPLGQYFAAPEVMYEILQHLNQLSFKNRLLCSCGRGQVSFSLQPDSVQLYCPACGATRVLSARCQDDVQSVRKQGEIQVDSPLNAPTWESKTPLSPENG